MHTSARSCMKAKVLAEPECSVHESFLQNRELENVRKADAEIFIRSDPAARHPSGLFEIALLGQRRGTPCARCGERDEDSARVCRLYL